MAEDLSQVKYEVHELPHVRNQPKYDAHGHCAKCLYWQSLAQGFPSAEHNVRGRQGEHIGECRFHAPSVAQEEAHWPITYDFDWCGNFKPRVGTGGLAALGGA